MIPTSRPESRCALLALFASSPAALAAIAATPGLSRAIGATTPAPGPQNAPDAPFWAAFAHMEAIDAAWNAEPGEYDPDAELHRHWYTLFRTAQITMLTYPVETAAAILAKWRHCEGDEIRLPAPHYSTRKVIEDDLARLASREVRA